MYKLTMEDVLMLLSYNDRFLILTHKKPDGDTLGSAVALCIALRQRGKTAYIKNSGEITGRFYDMCSPYFEPEGFEPLFVVSVDIADVKLLPDNCAQYKDDIMLSVDHHPSNTQFAGHNYVVDSAAATGEIIYDILEKLGTELTKDRMTAIYVAVSTDTGCFRYSNTTKESHIIAAKAIEAGVDFPYLNKILFDTKSMARMNLEKCLYQNTKYYFDKSAAVGILQRAVIDEYEATEDDMENISSYLRKIEGIECAATAIEQKNGDLKFSLRSGETIDVSAVAQAMGGGGHKRAAGFVIKHGENTEEKIAQLLEEIGKQMGESRTMHV